MATYVHGGMAIDHTPASAVTAGDVIEIGALVGVAPRDIAANEKGAVQMEGVFDMPTESATVFAAGAAVYWNDATGFCVTSTGETLCGHAIAASGDGDTVVRVKLGR